MPKYRHIAKSAGLLFHPETRFDMVRPSILLYPRALSNRATVLICGMRAPVVGRLCMDMTED